MGLIGDNCVTCREAGGWWTFWADVRDSLGAYRTSADKSVATATGKRQLGLHRRWHRREFRAGRWRVVRGTVGVFKVEMMMPPG
jgi:hypothetical protein